MGFWPSSLPMPSSSRWSGTGHLRLDPAVKDQLLRMIRRLNTEMPNRFKPSIEPFNGGLQIGRTAIARRLVLGCNYDVDSENVPCGIDANRS